MKKKILFVTSSRAEYGIIKNVINIFNKDKYFINYILITGSHLESKFGNTYKEITNNNNQLFKIKLFNKKLDHEGVIQNISKGLIKYKNFIQKIKPDLIFLLGDRYEILSVSLAANFLLIPVAHIHGGEISLGSFDNATRNTISQFSKLHFTATSQSKKRLENFGINKKNIFHVGSPSLSSIKIKNLLKKSQLEKNLKINFSKINIICTYHPETISKINEKKNITTIIKAFKKFKNCNVFFTGINPDPKSQSIYDVINLEVKKNKNFYYFKSLGNFNYLSLVNCSQLVIGNSSSGLIEVPFLKKYSINLGIRQKGREKPISVIDCEINQKKIIKSINFIIKRRKIEKKVFISPYFKKDTEKNIVQKVKKYLKNEK